MFIEQDSLRSRLEVPGGGPPGFFDYSFKLPKNVDFHFYLLDHASDKQAQKLSEHILSGTYDLVMLESYGYTEIHSDKLTTISNGQKPPIALRVMSHVFPNTAVGFQANILNAIYKARVDARFLDVSQNDNPTSDLLKPAGKSEEIFLRKHIIRDQRSLEKLKPVLQDHRQTAEIKNQTRVSALIFRGLGHVYMMRALEWQIQNNTQSNNTLSYTIDLNCPDITLPNGLKTYDEINNLFNTTKQIVVTE